MKLWRLPKIEGTMEAPQNRRFYGKEHPWGTHWEPREIIGNLIVVNHFHS
jgi:hypothetical protein